jgi:hypothetical protein
MNRVFVSYSRENSDSITQLTQDLGAVGIDAWYDQTLTGGQRWWDNILLNIRQCDVFIFALSPSSWDSEACRSELGYVKELGKTVLPVLVADGINTNLLPFPLKEIQITDYRRRDKEAALALVKCINTAPPAAPLPDPLPSSPKVPTSYLSSLQERVDSDEPLTAQDQIKLVFDLETGLRDGRSPTEIGDLLLKLKRRSDLLARVATSIDGLLKTLEKTPMRPQESMPPERRMPQPSRANGRIADDRGMDEPMLCSQCRAQVEKGSKFCKVCGVSQAEQNRVATPSPVPVKTVAGAAANRRSKQCRYECRPNDAPALITDLKSWLDAQGFDCQQMNTEDQCVLLQVKRRGGWRDFVGMSTSLNIVFNQSGDALVVEIGAGKWIDKAAAGVVSIVVLWPLALTAGFGAWEQMKMPDRIFDYIGRTRLVSLAS